MNSTNLDNNVPLVIDLDGTLLKTDLLYEGIILLLKKNPVYILVCIFWLLKGKVYFKKNVFKNIRIEFELLPRNEELISYIRNEYTSGRRLVLASASLKSTVNEFSRNIAIFDDIYGTEEVNLEGKNKLKVLVDNFGEFRFDYIGNSNTDLEIFAKSRYSYLVNPSMSLERKTRRISNLKYIWKRKKVNLKSYLKAIRAYQWLKNLLIFVPLITSHSYSSVRLTLLTVSGFFAFNFIASAGYVINDLLDLNLDRIHPRKKYRSFASGEFSISTGLTLIVILLLMAVLISLQLNWQFLVILSIYLFTSLAYSFYFKRIVLYDVFILSLLYSVRVIAGGFITKIPLSFWLIAFSTFLFLSLAFVKRYSELMHTNDDDGLVDRGRQYKKADLNLLQIMGIASGFISIVVFSLYIDSPEVRILYSNPNALWMISFCMMLWISRIWIVTNRGEMTDDPIIYALKDTRSYGLFLTSAFILWISL